jgi:hypothetical protein
MPMKILLVLPAGESVRVTREHPDVPKRAMLRFSVLSLTVVAALTPPCHNVRIIDENVEPLDFDVDVDVDLVGITFMTALAPRAYEIARRFRAKANLSSRAVSTPPFAPWKPPNILMPWWSEMRRDPGSASCKTSKPDAPARFTRPLAAPTPNSARLIRADLTACNVGGSTGGDRGGCGGELQD